MNSETETAIIKWMTPENFAKLSTVEQMKIALAYSEATEKIAHIIIKAMAKEEKTTFLFKL